MSDDVLNPEIIRRLERTGDWIAQRPGTRPRAVYVEVPDVLKQFDTLRPDMLRPALAAAMLEELARQRAAEEATLKRLKRELAGLALAARTHQSGPEATSTAEKRSQRARAQADLEQITDAEDQAREQAARYGPADAALLDLLLWWAGLKQEVLEYYYRCRGQSWHVPPPEVEAALAVHAEWAALTAALTAAARLPRDPYRSDVEKLRPDVHLGADLRSRARPVSRPARYAWQDLVDVARGTTPAPEPATVVS